MVEIQMQSTPPYCVEHDLSLYAASTMYVFPCSVVGALRVSKKSMGVCQEYCEYPGLMHIAFGCHCQKYTNEEFEGGSSHGEYHCTSGEGVSNNRKWVCHL